MKLTIQRRDLLRALEAVCSNIRPDNTVISYGGVMLEADDGGKLSVITSNPTRSVRYVLEADIDDQGSCIVPGELLLRAVKAMASEAVTMRTVKTTLTVVCGGTSLYLNTLGNMVFDSLPSMYETFPTFEPESSVTIPAWKFTEMARRAIRYVLREPSRPHLMGVHLRSHMHELRMRSTDATRYFEARTLINDQSDVDAIVSTSMLREMLDVEDDVTVGIARGACVMSSGPMTCVGRTLAGTFPPLEMLAPKGERVTVDVSAVELRDALRTIACMAEDNRKVVVSICRDRLLLTASSPEKGEINEEIPLERDETVEASMAFAHSKMLEGTISLDEEAQLSIFERMGVLTSHGDFDCIYLLMPVLM